MALIMEQFSWRCLMNEPLDYAFACDEDKLEVHRSSVISCQFS